ncbi:unnamed protein product [Owenia fusiformis]|uniref:Enoyl-CoA hydratase domain-containing protein 3, mitochondrial n=1 Tax=Owenia fusiformis TaxID=6347 RepID=A0A8S4N5U6_OWEFU|nr:unnamed protein product [Owenia fusiformis]
MALPMNLFSKFRSLWPVCQHVKSAARLSSQASGTKLTLVSDENGVRRILLNNARKRNALSLAMLESLRDDILVGIDKEGTRVIVIAHDGPVFSSGHDLKELTTKEGREYHTKVFSRCSEVMKLVQDVPVPVIAQVNGLATAAGCQLVASCDMAVVSDKSKFATPGVSIGLFCSTPAVALARAVPRKVAMEMLFTGFPIDAKDALQHGLVNRVVPEEELETETRRLTDRICETSHSVTALGKTTFYDQIARDRNSAYVKTERVMVENLGLKDGQEGLAAFLGKRKPTWTHGTDPAE